MQEKETNELEQVLGRTHLAEYNVFLEKHKGSMLSDSTSFSAYVKAIMREKGVTQQIAFLKADIPERYGYKLLSASFGSAMHPNSLLRRRSARLENTECLSYMPKYRVTL